MGHGEDLGCAYFLPRPPVRREEQLQRKEWAYVQSQALSGDWERQWHVGPCTEVAHLLYLSVST